MNHPQKQFSAMIMAAGLGKRMRSHNDTLPKPMVPVAGKPLISYTLTLLRNAEISGAVVNTHYKPEAIETYLAQQSDLTLSVSRETELLETGGGIKQAFPQLSERFFVLNSDVICADVTPPILRQMYTAWDDATMDALLLIIPVERAIGYSGKGDFALAEDGHTLLPILENLPSAQGAAQSGRGSKSVGGVSPPASENYVFTGVQLLHKRFLQDSPEGAFSLSPLYKAALAKSPRRLHALVHPGAWYHVGDGEGVRLAEDKLALNS